MEHTYKFFLIGATYHYRLESPGPWIARNLGSGTSRYLPSRQSPQRRLFRCAAVLLARLVFRGESQHMDIYPNEAVNAITSAIQSPRQDTILSPTTMLRPICRHAARPLTVALRSAASGRRHMTTPVSFDWKDPLNANSLLTEEEQAISETAESYCQERMLPRVLGECSPAL